MGKNISGSGMDTNVIGRKRNDRRAMGDETPRVLRIFVRDLTEATHGNATGIGMAEFATRRLVDKIDYHATYTNVITGQHVSAGAVPLHCGTDAEVLDIALESIGLIAPEDARVLWIPNTLDLGEVEASEAYLAQADIRDDLEILTGLRPLETEADGNLPPSKPTATACPNPFSQIERGYLHPFQCPISCSKTVTSSTWLIIVMR